MKNKVYQFFILGIFVGIIYLATDLRILTAQTLLGQTLGLLIMIWMFVGGIGLWVSMMYENYIVKEKRFGWFLIILFTTWVGSIMYYFFVYRKAR